ncbi:MAG: hypothetical protein ACYDH4_11450 [Candidatus Cryosericum sp.]
MKDERWRWEIFMDLVSYHFAEKWPVLVVGIASGIIVATLITRC